MHNKCFNLGEVTRECTEHGEWKVPAYNCIRPALERLQKQVSSWAPSLIINRKASWYSVTKQQTECEFRSFYLSHHSKSKKGGKDQEMIRSSTILDPGYHMGK